MIPQVPLAEACEVTMGQAPVGSSYNTNKEGYALIAGAGDFGEITPEPKKYTVKPTRISESNDLILCIRATIGDLNWSDAEYCLGRGVAGLRPMPGRLDRNYLWHFIQANKGQLIARGTGSTFKQVSRSHIEEWKIPLPPLSEQKRIAAILDKADAIRRKRQQAIDLTDQLLRSVFLDMFGDPVTNPKGWPMMSLRDASTVFSDGPFGSNLKSSHYTNEGVRVIRLQNIGLGELIDIDKAFVSEQHYKTLSKHTCLPGDVLVATLGDPNIRACTLPKTIEKAINKADCVQFRVNTEIGTADYFSALLNLPVFIVLVRHLLHGQTRTRVSMGALREVAVPVPHLAEQKKFSDFVHRINNSRVKFFDQNESIINLINSLTQRAFCGELTKQTKAA